jgi:hypothetical protein
MGLILKVFKLFLSIFRSEIEESINQQSKILDNLLADYDKRFIPALPGL